MQGGRKNIPQKGNILWEGPVERINRKKLKGSVDGMPKWMWNLGWSESGKGAESYIFWGLVGHVSEL